MFVRIVAAVLGIVITMGAIDGPVEQVGHKVGAALVGTFLGILLSYGFFGPLAARMELLGAAEIGFFRATANIIFRHFNRSRSLGTVVLFAEDSAEMDEPGRAQLNSLVPMLLGKPNKVEK